MGIEMIIALIIAIPVILFPAAFVWYVNIGRISYTLRKVRAAREKRATVATTIS